MASVYTVEYYKILRPTKTIRKLVTESNALSKYYKDEDSDCEVEFLSADELATSPTGMSLLKKYPEYLATHHGISYDDHAAMLRESRTYKNLYASWERTPLTVSAEIDYQIQESYVACETGSCGDMKEISVFEANGVDYKKNIRSFEEEPIEVFRTTKDFGVTFETKVGFYVKFICACGKRSLKNVYSAHRDFENHYANNETIYIHTDKQLKAAKACVLPEYRGRWNKLWSSKNIPYGYFFEITH